MRTNFQTWLNSLTNDDGSGTTGDLLNVSWFTDQMDVIGGDLDDIDDEITALQNVGFLSGYDSVLYTYKDANTITIQAGGQFTVSDDSTVIKVAANTDLTLSTGRSTDCAAEAASTLYYVWGGQTSLGATAFYFHTSATAMPSELTKGKRMRGAVRNNNSSDIMPFVMTPTTYWYDVNISFDGSDATEVLDTLISMSFVNVDCSGLIPQGKRVVMLYIKDMAGGINLQLRTGGSSITTGVNIGRPNFLHYIENLVNDAGLLQVRQINGEGLLRISVGGYELC